MSVLLRMVVLSGKGFLLSLLQNFRTILSKGREGKKVDFYPYLITEIKLSKEELVGENPTISRGVYTCLKNSTYYLLE